MFNCIYHSWTSHTAPCPICHQEETYTSTDSTTPPQRAVLSGFKVSEVKQEGDEYIAELQADLCQKAASKMAESVDKEIMEKLTAAQLLLSPLVGELLSKATALYMRFEHASNTRYSELKGKVPKLCLTRQDKKTCKFLLLIRNFLKGGKNDI